MNLDLEALADEITWRAGVLLLAGDSVTLRRSVLEDLQRVAGQTSATAPAQPERAIPHRDGGRDGAGPTTNQPHEKPMTELTIESLGLTKDEIMARLIDRLAEDLESTDYASVVAALEGKMTERLDAALEAVIDQHVLPKAEELVAGLTFRTTNQYGEPKGDPQTLREWLVARAEKYLIEPVNRDGKNKAEGGYQWNAHSSRLVHMVHTLFDREITTAIGGMLKEANSQLAGGIVEATKLKLAELLSSLKISVVTGR